MLNLLGCYVGVEFTCEICQASFFSHVAITAVQLPTPVFVGIIYDKRKNQTKTNKPQTKSKGLHPQEEDGRGIQYSVYQCRAGDLYFETIPWKWEELPTISEYS